jgi:hypothetical protein
MATITADTPTDARTPRQWRTGRMRARLAAVGSRGTQMASAARHRYRRPALVISSFSCGVASAWHTFGLGAGLLAMGAAGLVLEFLGGTDEDDR